MKKILFITLLTVVCFSCNKVDLPDNEDSNSQYINIKLNVKQESVDMSHEPLRSTTNDRTYAINVYQMNPNTDTYEYYCCGVFDNADDLSISFQKGYKYKLHIAMFINYFNHYSFSIDNHKQQSTTKLTSASNSFQYESSSIYDLEYNYYGSVNNETYLRAIRPNVDSFHAIKEGYEPTENNSLNITLKRSSFGITVNVEGMEEGSINTTLRTQNYYNYIQPEFNINYPDNTYSEIYTMLNPISESDTMNVSIKYTNANGETTELIKDIFTFNRNVRTIFNIKINKNNDTNTDSDISINIDNAEFTETTYNYNCYIN